MAFAYDSLDSSSNPLLIVYLTLMIFSWIMTIILYKKWKENDLLTRRLLFFTFLAYSICISIITIGFIEAVVTGLKKEIYRFSLAAGYCGLMISNIFLMYFAAEILVIEKKHLRKYIIISVIIAVLVALPFNYYGISGDEIEGLINIRPITSALMMFFSVITYLRIYLQLHKTSKLVEEKIARASLNYISYSQICMILLFVFLLADLILFGLTDSKGYTIFSYFAWSCVAFFLIFSYLGLIMPTRYKKRNLRT